MICPINTMIYNLGLKNLKDNFGFEIIEYDKILFYETSEEKPLL